jgi:hypothetical protein
MLYDIACNLNCIEIELNFISKHFNWVKFKFNWIYIQSNSIQIQLKKNDIQVAAKCIENMFVTSIIYDCVIKIKEFWKEIIPKKHLCIILHMVLDISFEITKAKDHMKDPPYT